MGYSEGMVKGMKRAVGLWVVAAAALAVGIGLLAFSDRLVGERNPFPARNVPQPIGPPSVQQIVAAVGDIACKPNTPVGGDECQMQATADLVAERYVDAVFLLGDLQYQDGTLVKFRQSFDESWGALTAPSYPVPGNHEYGTVGAKGYFDYFGSRAGEQGKGYYSFDLGSWHIVALNSNCGGAGGCSENSLQGTWLKQDLAAHQTECTLAFWHHPRFSSGRYHPGEVAVRSFWEILSKKGVDVVLNGHDHLYERFTPMRPDGTVDLEKGIRQFTIGTGGRSLYEFTTVLPTSEARNDKEFGVLFLTLGETQYSWEFTTVDGTPFDAGSGICHGSP